MKAILVLALCLCFNIASACVQMSADGQTYTIDKSGCVE